MSTFRFHAAFAASATALLCASTSFAQEPTASETRTPNTQTTQTTPPPTQPVAPSQQVTVAQPAASQPAAPVGTTTTTASPYSPTGARYSERSIETRPNRALLSTGAGIFILSYGASVIAGASSDRDSDKRLFIPVVGPWMDLADRQCNLSNPCGSNEDLAKAMIVTSGVVQGAGVLLAIGSLAIPESTRVEERTVAKAKSPPKPKFAVLPVSFRAGAGVGAVGRF
jgi:hypothetical protein